MKEELKKATDYSEGQKTAAYMVLGEIVNLLNEFSDNIRIIGGWVPTLLYPDGGHIGSIDVDVLLNQLEIKKAESYRTIKRILTQNGYRRHEEKYFRNLLGGLYRENPVKSRNYEAVKSSKKWENVGNSYIIPALLLYRYSYI